MTPQSSERIAVASRSFSKNPVLRAELQSRYPSVTFNQTGKVLNGQELIEFLKGHTKAIVGLETITEEILKGVPEIQGFSKYGVGLDMVDLPALARRNVKFGWTGGVNKRSVAELALTFSLLLIRSVHQSHEHLNKKSWTQVRGHELSGKTFGIIGCGHVGKDLIGLLKPFGCKVLVHDIREYAQFYRENQVTAVSLETLLAQADVVTLHVPLDPSTRNIMSEARLKMMKKGAILLNTARGNLVDETALLSLLESGHIGAAGFDVFAVEPPTHDPLLLHPNFYGTPHMGGSSVEAVLAMGRAAIENLETMMSAQAFLDSMNA